MPPPFIFDVHLDLSLNAQDWNRDLRRPLDDLRKVEAHLNDKAGRGRGTVTLPLEVTEMEHRVGWLPLNSPGCHVHRDLGVTTGAIVSIGRADQ